MTILHVPMFEMSKMDPKAIFYFTMNKVFIEIKYSKFAISSENTFIIT